MLEPQSIMFFILLIGVFGGLMWLLMVTRSLPLRMTAACLAFIPAMAFGVAAVNRYYNYYQTWGSAIADITNQGIPAPTGPTTVSKPSIESGLLAGHYVDIALARQQGYTLPLRVHGRSSNITRTVYVFLPPQYFWPGYQKYRFPAIELIHGFPGTPQDWITVLGVNSVLDTLVSQHRAKPTVLVMPDANGGRGVSLQCLNQVHGPPDATFLARDLPAYIAAGLRVQQPGGGWGIAGYSEGGFCAANLGLQDGRVYSYAGVLSGYFRPSDNQLANPSRQVSPFGGNRRMERTNTPLDLLRSLPIGRLIPQFWLGAGLLDGADVRNAESFGQLLQLRQPAVTVKLVPGGGHSMLTWRQLLPPMLRWMTNGLAQEVSRYDSRPIGARAPVAAAARNARRLERQARRRR
jgi:enterochelin esterase-like enzyme